MADDVDLTDSYKGLCAVCGADVTFVRDHVSVREGYRCPECRSSNRYRGQAAAIAMTLGRTGQSMRELADAGAFAGLRVYEPGIKSPFRKYFGGVARLETSFYWDDVNTGEERDGVQCQDLQCLTFADGSFDLLVSSDIFEHIRRPWEAFAETHRVLVPGGAHVFSVPGTHPIRATTRYRVDTSSNIDIELEAAVYHGNGAGGKSLVYVDYGLDMVGELDRIGLDLKFVRAEASSPDAARLITFVATKR